MEKLDGAGGERKRIVPKTNKERSSDSIIEGKNHNYAESKDYNDLQKRKANEIKKPVEKIANYIYYKNLGKPKDYRSQAKTEVNNIIDNEKQEFLKRISDYREKEKSYIEEKIRLENLLQKLNEELKLSQQKDEEDYLISLEPEKEKLELKNNAGLEEVQEEDEKKINGEDNETPKEEIPSDVDKIIEEIPGKDKKIIEEVMKTDTPMEFESPSVKVNHKDFIKNNIVKFASGFKISPKIKRIIERNTKKVLMTTAILTIWTNSGSFVKPNGVKGDIKSIKTKEIVNEANKNKSLETIDIDTYNKLSENGKKIYLYENSKTNDSYIIIDKPSATLSIIGADKKLICQIPVLLGKTKGETPNMSDPDSDVAVEATTPAGKYTMGRLGVNEEDNILYKGKIFNICGSDGLALHITYPLEKEKRTKALNTLTTDDNRLSWGCINVSEEMWVKYIEGNVQNRGTCLFITPDDPLTSLNPETGQVERKIDNNFLAMNH